MERLQNPLAEGFKEQYKWWSAVELGRRFVSVAFIIFFPRTQVRAFLFNMSYFYGMPILDLPITVSLYGAGALWPHATIHDTSH